MTQTSSNHKIKRAVAITDICGYGKCSLGITIPVLATAGIEVCPIPTGIFDTHTAIDNYEYLPTDSFVENYPKK
ncbi:MAG: hypothetical protein MJ060_04490 [Clostridia bacterium]|nr:hypothetical protein [Clostridia bacterium]